ncbi:tRNA-guanine transglycosylase [Legionella impletisoli]|nr:tRNA-guanine transglycosylase [Legionella impletisoli]
MNQKKLLGKPQFIPLVSTVAGRALTAESWSAAGVRVLSCSLESLLMKPGYDTLLKLTHLKRYLAWPHQLVLNASLPKRKSETFYTVRSTYDGKVTQLTLLQLVKLSLSLDPDILILPKLSAYEFESIQSFLPNHKEIFLTFSDAEQPSDYGYYYPIDEANALLDSSEFAPNRSYYLAGSFNVYDLTKLAAKGVAYLESDKPASDAMQGKLYTEKGMLDITETVNEFNFEPVESDCFCTSCKKGFSRAYFHHLYSQTPLLCQRLLIEHNIHYSQAKVRAIHLRQV